MPDSENQDQPQKAKRRQPGSAPELNIVRFDDDIEDHHSAVANAAPLLTEDSKPPQKPLSSTASEDEEKTETDEEAFANLEHGLDDIPDSEQEPKKQSRVKRFFAGYWRRKLWTLPLTLVVVLGILAGVPFSRYLILGQFMEADYKFRLIDTKTGKPVSGAELSSEGEKVKTDSKGAATLRLKVGEHQVKVDKKYYQDLTSSFFVGIKKRSSPEMLSMVATGRQVPLTVVNKVTGKPLENASLKAAGTEVKTGKDGKVMMVLPADKGTLNITLSASGFNGLQTTVEVTEQSVKQNSYGLTPNGKVYFMSQLSGKLDLVKTNLDGSNRQTVLGGTGKEDLQTTQLLASRDWKYLALLSKRGSDASKIYLISTDTDKLTTIDGSDSTFSLIGWNNHNFVFQSTRNGAKEWEPNRSALKSFSADTNQVVTLDQTQAEGDQNSYQAQAFANVYQLGDRVVYSVQWSGWYLPTNTKTSVIRSVSVKDQSKKDLKTFGANDVGYIDSRPYEPNEVYFATYSNVQNKYSFFELSDTGKDVSVKDADLDQDTFFNKPYNTYLTSPDGTKTFWNEGRDGRSAFFIGDSKGDNGKQVATLDDYSVYGWYTDGYVLLTKKSSELYIMSVNGGNLLKVSDYFKTGQNIRGYGGGYGGL